MYFYRKSFEPLGFTWMNRPRLSYILYDFSVGLAVLILASESGMGYILLDWGIVPQNHTPIGWGIGWGTMFNSVQI